MVPCTRDKSISNIQCLVSFPNIKHKFEDLEDVKVVAKCEEIHAIWQWMTPLFEVGSVDSKDKD
jgi:hypothetical protein